MKRVPATITNDAITVFFNGGSNPKTVSRASPQYTVVRAALMSGDFDENGIAEFFGIKKAIAKYTAGRVIVEESGVYFDGIKVNSSVATRIMEFATNGLPFGPLVQFLTKLKANPSKRSTDTLFDFLDREGLTICTDGDFLAYKAITVNWRDKWTGTINNGIGATPRMPRSEVCDDPLNGCAPGLHMGSHKYATDYASGDDRVVITKCNPANVVCVPHDCSYQKIRTCGYEVQALYRGALPSFSFDIRNPYKGTKVSESEWDLR